MAINIFETYDNVVRKEHPVAKPEVKEDELFVPDDEKPAAPVQAQVVPEIDLNALADLILEKMNAQKAAEIPAEEGGSDAGDS